ncbi:helicase 2 [Carcinus maenas nudivirus]|uniref:Helicase 2 n=1 Tax=Carcinus maenas nudivirus TaxID=2880837 RepID=A0AAE9BZW9_9VIRU|nr:helicase 2 [Carcinus maenas nudivirus]UBZ25657.1 helicase 2 [Carcinus maenas nudivirus]
MTLLLEFMYQFQSKYDANNQLIFNLIFNLDIMDILNVKISSLDDLIKLSLKSRNCLLSHVRNHEKLTKFKNIYKKYFQLVWNENDVKIFIILNSLNDNQKYAYLHIFDSIMENTNGGIYCIDACPGTGKTFLTACILMSYVEDSTYMVYTNKLSDIMRSVYFDGVSITCCKFLMRLLNKNYMVIKNIWNVKNLTLEEKCKDVEKIAREHKPIHNLYIIDENSVLSPFFIYFMYCLSVFHKIHVLFVGDRYQQTPINSTKYHSSNNFKLINLIATTYDLTVNVRQSTDQPFVNLLSQFLQYFKKSDNVIMNFDIKYFFYNVLSSKFHTTENFNSMYFAAYHVLLKDRLLKYEKYLDSNAIKYTKAYLQNRTGGFKDMIPELKKFRPYIILVLNKKYIYSPNSTISFIVTLKEIGKDYLRLFNHELKRNIIVRRIAVNTFFVSEQLIMILSQNGCSTAYQYPLRELISTYHAAQGLTISNINVELNLDCKNINSFYVGLTRIKKLEQLTKIHTKDLLNLAYTKKKNDNYYYRIINYPKNIENLKFVECNNIQTFESSSILKNLKIHKNLYANSANISDKYTDLMKYIKNTQLIL